MILNTLRHIRSVLRSSSGVNRRYRRQDLFRSESLEQRQLLAASGLQAFHRSGQTFITWTEDGSVAGEKYHVYRSNSPITTANIASAEKLTSKWGALDDNTSVHKYVAPNTGVPSTFVIQDLGTPLPTNRGLIVYTTPESQSGTWFYAVTQVTNSVESLALTSGSNTLTTGVSETVATPQPVLTVSNATGKGRIYTQYMDYAKWNPTFQGYAYNYSVALPEAYDPGVAWPIKLMPHAYGERFRMEPAAEYGWPSIEIFLDDSGGGAPGMDYQTWWYGFAADHNYLTDGSIPSSGRVENFTEQRILKAIDEVSTLFNVDEQRTHAQGHSMGASGSLSLGMRYADVFSGIFASEPMTNYASSPGFQEDFAVLWGTQSSNLPIVNNGVHAGPLKKYDGLGIYNWMNHHEQLVNRRGDPMAFLMVGHGKADDVIDWATQGRPFIAALNAGNVGFTAEQRFGWDHNWMSFDFSLDSMFSPADGGLSAWAYPTNVSFPGLTNATGSGPDVPGVTGTNFYNMQFEWSVPWNNFHTDIVDTVTSYEISLRSVTVTQAVDVTPQRRQAFHPTPGSTVNWQNVNNATGQVVQSGTLVVDADGLVTLPQVTIGTGTGNRLIITGESPRPSLNALPATVTNQRPTFSWQSVPGAVSYDLFVRNLSTGENPAFRRSVSGLSDTPTQDLGIGRYRVWVRARFASGQFSTWSNTREFQINTAPVIADLPSVVSSGLPNVAWSNLPGAVRYELRIDNQTTGQRGVVQDSGILGSTSYQVTSNLGVGLHQVYVRGFDVAGVPGLWSAGERFVSSSAVETGAPNGPSFNTQPGFNWSALPGATRYELLLQNRTTNVTAANPSNLNTTNWVPTAPLATGDYRWQVRGVTSTGILGGWSIAKDFNVGGKPTLQNIPASTNDRTPTITWTAVTGAVRYEVWFVRAAGNVLVLNPRGLTTNSFAPTADLVPQKYRVWVRAISSTGVVSAWSTPAVMTVTSTVPSIETIDETLLSLLDSDVFPGLTETSAVEQSNPASVAAQIESTASPQPEAVIANQDDHSEQFIDELMAEWTAGGQSSG